MKLISVFILAALLFSCSISKKNQKAVNRVKADINLLNDVGNSWQQLHPCVVDTIHEFINGKEIIRYDTLDFSHIDTVYNVDTQTKIIYRTVDKYITKVDTLKVYVIDNRAERLAQNDLSKSQGQNAQLEKDKSELKKELSKTRWWGIGGSVFLLLVIAGLVYHIIKK